MEEEQNLGEPGDVEAATVSGQTDLSMPFNDFRVKRVLRWSHTDRMLRLFRVMWQRGSGVVGCGYTDRPQPYDVKLSFAVAWEPRDIWIGVYWTREPKSKVGKEAFVYVCLIPCLPLRVHYGPRSYGGKNV